MSARLLPYSMRSIEEFSAIPGIARKNGIEINVTGSVVTRFVRERIVANDSTVDLFRLAPGTSDIDIVHSGSEELTAQILEAIYDSVPTFECFRWEVRAIDQRFVRAREFNSMIPVCMFRLSSDPAIGLIDEENGETDLRDRNYRFVRNARYHESPLFKDHRDLELFGALLYFKTVLDADLGKQLNGMDGYEDAVFIVQQCTHDSNDDTLARLREHPQLRRRLLYLLSGMACAGYSHKISSSVAHNVGVLDLLRVLPEPVQRQADGWFMATTPIAISSYLGADTFRFPSVLPDMIERTKALEEARDVLRKAAPGSEQIAEDEPVQGAGIEILGMSEWIDVTPGSAASSAVVLGRRLESFSITLNLRVQDDPLFASIPNEEDLSCTLAVEITYAGKEAEIVMLAPPVVCSVRHVEDADAWRLHYRVSVGSLFEALYKGEQQETVSKVRIRLFLTQCESVATLNDGAGPLPDVGSPRRIAQLEAEVQQLTEMVAELQQAIRSSQPALVEYIFRGGLAAFDPAGRGDRQGDLARRPIYLTSLDAEYVT